MAEQERNCDCSLCKNKHDINIPFEVVEDVLTGKVSLFTGAGISTESREVLNITFYEEVLEELQITSSDWSFPKLMQEFCKQPNGRMKLLQKIRSRFKTIDAFPELQSSSTRFHRELGTLFPVKNIITTNWDTYFEDFCKATPFVSDSDLAFWEVADRRVLKIHGSIDNLSTIVATEDDYLACSKKLNSDLIGSVLKTILATQTVIFIGYSMRDSDFQEVYGFVRKQMDALHRQAYIVTPFESEAKRFKEAGLIPIVTDGAHFIKLIKDHAIAQDLLIPDTHFYYAEMMLALFEHEHATLYEKLKNTDYPQVIYAGIYQDGVMHALQRALRMRHSGEYSHRCRLITLIEKYEEIKARKIKAKNYSDVAYVEGYINGLFYILIGEQPEEEAQLPMYFAFGCNYELVDFDSFIDFIEKIPEAHKSSLKFIRKKFKGLKDPNGVVFHHPPWI